MVGQLWSLCPLRRRAVHVNGSFLSASSRTCLLSLLYSSNPFPLHRYVATAAKLPLRRLIAHRCSIVERGGCLQRRPFVCLSLCLSDCQHDNFRTIKCRMMKLSGKVHCTNISPEFECQGQRSKVKVTGDKRNENVRHFFVSGPRVHGPLHRWENQRMLSSAEFCSHCRCI